MALSLGSALATRVYLGATEINLAYFGATQVYTSSAFSAEAQDYFDRLDTAGDTTYVDYKLPLANYIDGLVTLGGAYWDDMLSAASFVGVGIQGITVPLRAGMVSATNVNNNFVAGDLDVLTGLKGDGSTKYIDTGLTTLDFTITDVSFSTHITTLGTAGKYYMGAFSGSDLMHLYHNPGDTARTSLFGGLYSPGTSLATGLYGSTRTGTTEAVRVNDTAFSRTSTASAPVSTAVSVFATSGLAPISARLATYHAGPALNLATLESLQDTLMSEIRTAHTFVAVADYFSRLDTAGDTTYLTYKQPLTNYISSLVELGGAYWDTMESACSYVGVGIQGITVPLRAGMTVATNVNNNFVAADLDQLTGLKGDGSTKYIDTGTLESAVPQNDISMSVYVTESTNTYSLCISGTAGNDRTGLMVRSVNSGTVWNRSGTSTNFTGAAVPEFYGTSRDNGLDYDLKNGSTLTTVTQASSSSFGGSVCVFSASTGVGKTTNRIATYHYGPALNMATLRSLQATLITEIAAI
jgi:hypothetical protein